jgi:hypothetical protein
LIQRLKGINVEGNTSLNVWDSGYTVEVLKAFFLVSVLFSSVYLSPWFLARLRPPFVLVMSGLPPQSVLVASVAVAAARVGPTAARRASPGLAKSVTYVAAARCAGVGGLAQGDNGRRLLHLFFGWDGYGSEDFIFMRRDRRCTWSPRKEVPALTLLLQ